MCIVLTFKRLYQININKYMRSKYNYLDLTKVLKINFTFDNI